MTAHWLTLDEAYFLAKPYPSGLQTEEYFAKIICKILEKKKKKRIRTNTLI